MEITNIEAYYNWIVKNPDKVCKKVRKIYERLNNDLKTPKTVSFFNKATGENETHTYIFDKGRASEPIKFI